MSGKQVGRQRVTDYRELWSRINGYLRRAESQRNRCYAYILLLVLGNGLRLGEAVRAYQRHLRTGETVFEMPVTRRKTSTTRVVVLPQVEGGIPRCEDMAGEDAAALAERVRMFAKNHFGVSVKTLRRAFVVHLLALGHDPRLVEEVTGHSDFAGDDW